MAESEAVYRLDREIVCRKVQSARNIFPARQIVDALAFCPDEDISAAVLAHTVNGIGDQSLCRGNLSCNHSCAFVEQFDPFAFRSYQYRTIVPSGKTTDRIGGMNRSER